MMVLKYRTDIINVQTCNNMGHDEVEKWFICGDQYKFYAEIEIYICRLAHKYGVT